MLRRRSPLPFLIAAVCVAALLVARSRDRAGDPSFKGAAHARVQRVVDGDTVRLAGLGGVRLIGIDTPEVHGGSIECFGPEASAFAQALLPRGTEIRYRVGRRARDRYGRLLAYVWLADGRMVNRLLAERGYATPLAIAPNDALAPAFRRAAAEARAAHRGMWARAGCAH
ncbi:MAG TPA: thermonuclease family protein [Thermoleophilaceae bacterium]|jgi:micrococcal nuclease